MGRVRVYIKPWNDSGIGHAPDWIEVTDDVTAKGISQIKIQLDRSEFDLGTFRPSENSIMFRNTEGRYSDIGESASLFRFRRAGTLMKYTWDLALNLPYPIAGTTGPDGAFTSNEVDIYKGYIEDISATMDAKKQEIKFKVLGNESILDRVTVPFSLLSNGDQISDIVYAALNQDAVKEYFTVSLSNIVPGYDAVIDDVSGIENQTAQELISDLLFPGNSVLYIDGDEIKLTARTAGASVSYSFYGPGSSLGPENMMALFDIRNGLNRLANYILWRNSSILAEDATSVIQNGIFKKEVSYDGITTTATKQDIVEAIRDSFSTKKQEIKITTPMNYDTLALKILDRVEVDNPAPVFSTTELPYYGIAEYGVAVYPNQIFAYTLDTSTNFMIIGKSIDALKEEISFQLREI